MKSSYKKQKRMQAIICALSVASILLLAGTIYQTTSVRALSRQTENKYMSAFTDLCDYLDDIDVLIKKAMLTTGTKHLSSVTTQIFMQTAQAKVCLSQLPLSDINLDKTSKFLVQTGDYASFLSAKAAKGETVTDKEFSNLSELSVYAKNISEDLDKIREKLYSGNFSFSDTKKMVSHAEDSEKSINADFSGLENEFAEYPALIYDGPFSDHIITQESGFLKFQGQITEKMALNAVKNILGEEKSENLTLSDEGGGAIESYIFHNQTDEQALSVAITKQGAHLLWMLDNRNVETENISVDEAKAYAIDFLKKAGYENMEESYYDKSANVATLNFAYSQSGITVYSDLIKVKVALDNGEILGIEANGYLMNHSEREVPQNIISMDEAKKRAGKHLSIGNIKLCFIPLAGGNEVLCYELHGTFDNENFLIYINAVTGEDERILMLKESADGILTV